MRYRSSLWQKRRQPQTALVQAAQQSKQWIQTCFRIPVRIQFCIQFQFQGHVTTACLGSGSGTISSRSYSPLRNTHPTDGHRRISAVLKFNWSWNNTDSLEKETNQYDI